MADIIAAISAMIMAKRASVSSGLGTRLIDNRKYHRAEWITIVCPRCKHQVERSSTGLYRCAFYKASWLRVQDEKSFPSVDCNTERQRSEVFWNTRGKEFPIFTGEGETGVAPPSVYAAHCDSEQIAGGRSPTDCPWCRPYRGVRAP